MAELLSVVLRTGFPDYPTKLQSAEFAASGTSVASATRTYFTRIEMDDPNPPRLSDLLDSQSRRTFLTRAPALSFAVPGLAAALTACSDRSSARDTTGATAGGARLRPALAAAAADAAGAAQVELERHLGAVERLAAADRHFGRYRLGGFTLAEKRVAHPLDERVDRRKVDRDFIGKAVLHTHTQFRLTIGAAFQPCQGNTRVVG